jgi:hypothetical protein
MLDALTGIVARHRSLAMHAGVPGPFYVKAHLENVWRTVPFLDMEKFMVYVHENGIPVVQEEDVLSPPGTALETFVLLPEKTELSEDIKDSLIDAIRIGWLFLRHSVYQESFTLMTFQHWKSYFKWGKGLKQPSSCGMPLHTDRLA